MAQASASTDPIAAPKPGLLSHWKIMTGAGLGLALVVAGYLYLTSSPELPPALQLKQALEDLDAGRLLTARKTVTKLQEAGYVDPEFPGGTDFVLGMSTFLETQAQEEGRRDQGYVVAATYLQSADKHSVQAARRMQCAQALGISLYQSGAIEAAVPHLKEAVLSVGPGRSEAALCLAEAYVDSHVPDMLQKALELNSTVIADTTLTPLMRDQAWQQRAQLLIALNRPKEADEAQTHLSKENNASQGLIVLQAQTLMIDKRYKEALELLAPIANSERLERRYPASAAYLAARCAERLGEIAQQEGEATNSEALRVEARRWLGQAATDYERTAERFEGTHEAVAARLGAGDVLRSLGRSEEALSSYGHALRSVRKPEQFRNRWLTLTRLRERIQTAWDEWVKADRHADAIALAEMMSPVYPRADALELVARANESWAAHLQGQLSAARKDRLALVQSELKERWKRCGTAFEQLAEARTKGYAEALLKSADFFVLGHDFERAVQLLTKYLESQPPSTHSLALLKRGKALLDLDRSEDAMVDFSRLIEYHPTDPNAFMAQYLIGRVHLERNELDQAERNWRAFLAAHIVTPDSEEWRLSVYGLSKLLMLRAEAELQSSAAAPGAVPAAGPPVDEASQKSLRKAAYRRLEEVISRLEEYFDRYPKSAEIGEAHFWHARALQQSADAFEEEIPGAETDFARSELQRQRLARLDRAIKEFQTLQALLIKSQKSDSLDAVGKALLRNTGSELARCQYHRGDYQSAVDAYQACINRDPLSTDSLLALVQVANCYKHLGEPPRAATALAQARLMLKQLPDSAFASVPGAMSREDWARWLEWAQSQFPPQPSAPATAPLTSTTNTTTPQKSPSS